MPKILALAANPQDTVQLRLHQEVREIRTRLRLAEARGFEVASEGAVRSQDLLRLLQQYRPTILHFSGHGTQQGEMVLEDDTGGSKAVSPETLRAIFSELKDNIRCVVLNSCYSEIQAVAIAERIDCVIGMSSAVYDEAAIAFAASFYQALGFGRSIRTAFELGCLEVALHGIPGKHIPKLHTSLPTDSEALYITGQPELCCEFVLDGNGRPTKDEDDDYEIRFFVRNLPDDTLSVVYQFNDSSFRDLDEEFLEIPNDGREGFEAFNQSSGDIEVRATIWQAKGGHGIRNRLARALERSHKDPNPSVKRALRYIREH